LAILYIETNFLMSIATGRDPEASILLGQTPASVQLVIPTRLRPAETKVFLSGNVREFRKILEVQDALRDAGITKYFSLAKDFLGWLQSQP
jgi:hypothetical protein